MASRNLLMALFLLMPVAFISSAPFPGASEEVEEALVSQAGGDGRLEEAKEEDVLPLQAVPDTFLASLESRLPFYDPEFLSEDLDVNVDAPFFPAPLKRGRYNRLDILKRSRLNQLIHRLLAMRGDRYSYHRASPVRFAAGRR